MIFALNMTCERDKDLSELMIETLIKYCPDLAQIRSHVTGGREFTSYENGAGWNASMMKLSAISKLYDDYDIKDDDFILSVDSDVVFTSCDVFDYINEKYGIIGILGQQPWKTINGPWAHMSGCLIFLRGDIGRKMIELTDQELHNIRYNEFKTCDITENEDVVLSYLANKCGAEAFDLSSIKGLIGSDFEGEMRCDMLNMVHDLDENQPSFYHLNYCPTKFLDEPVEGKWDIPKVLKLKNIEL